MATGKEYMEAQPFGDDQHEIFNDDRFPLNEGVIHIHKTITDKKLVKNESTTSIELLNDRPHFLTTDNKEQLDLHSSSASGYSKQSWSPSVVEYNPPFSFGVDWSDRAHGTSHCWLPYSSNNSSVAPSCAYALCTISDPTLTSTFIQCGSCTISIHRDHIAHLQKSADVRNYIESCRPSFSDNNIANDYSKHDRHHWAPISSLVKRCVRCKLKKVPRRLTVNNARILTNPTKSSLSEVNTKAIHTPEQTDSKLPEPSSCLVCLWCSLGCHRQCWESMKEDDDENKCDYGKFKNIIVRPQWISRVVSSSVHFHAQYTNDVNMSSLSFTPLIIFINKLSGGQKGEIIYRQLIRLLNPRQVFLLENDTTIKQAMDIYSSLHNTRIYICGGDGTVGWILSSLADIFASGNNPPVSICPLGTGNDLSRVLGWGWHYSTKQLLNALLQVSNAQPIALDRWQIAFEPLTIINPMEESRNDPKFVRQTDRPSYQNHRTPLNTRFTNYISFGLDAAVVLDFHDSRIHDPSRFTSPFRNKLLYLNISRKYFREFLLWRTWNLGSYMRLICDGKNMTDSLRHCHTIVLLNIPSYGSGTHPWSRTSSDRTTLDTLQSQSDRSDETASSKFESTDPSDYIDEDHKFTTADISNTNDHIGRQSINDRKIEVLGLHSVQMALIHIGFRGRRIAQCSEVRIELIRSMPVHMDGDPFYLPQSIAVNVTHAGQVIVLTNQNN